MTASDSTEWQTRPRLEQPGVALVLGEGRKPHQPVQAVVVPALAGRPPTGTFQP